MHAPIAMSAMQLGIHVYVQKPMAHDLYEARRLTEFAREQKLVTQMGIQIHSTAYYRLGVAVIQSGAIGKVKEVHLWTDRKWGDPDPVPTRSDPVPAGLNWDAWLGVCARGRSWAAATTIRATGGSVWISAPARWATWAATSSIRFSRPWRSARR